MPLTQRALASEAAQMTLLKRARAPSVAGVVIEAGDLAPDAQTVERWHAFMQRIARAAPTAVALSGDVSHDAVAMFAPADRIFARETGLILPGLLRGAPPPDPEIMLAASLPADKAADFPDAAATDAVRLALYRVWMRRALTDSPRARAEGVAAVERARPVSARGAIELGLIDDIGFAQDALDWTIERSGVERGKTRLAIVSPDG